MKGVEITFEEKPNFENIKKLIRAPITKTGDKGFIVESEDITEIIWKISKLTMENNLRITSLNTLTPSL